MQPSNAAIRQGRTIGREYGHHDVINQGLDQKCIVCFLCFADIKIINIRMFIKFFMFFLPMQGALFLIMPNP